MQENSEYLTEIDICSLKLNDKRQTLLEYYDESIIMDIEENYEKNMDHIKIPIKEYVILYKTWQDLKKNIITNVTAQDFKLLKAEYSNLKEEHHNLKEEFNNLKKDFNNLKEEHHNIKGDMNKLKEDFKEFTCHLNNIYIGDIVMMHGTLNLTIPIFFPIKLENLKIEFYSTYNTFYVYVNNKIKFELIKDNYNINKNISMINIDTLTFVNFIQADECANINSFLKQITCNVLHIIGCLSRNIKLPICKVLILENFYDYYHLQNLNTAQTCKIIIKNCENIGGIGVMKTIGYHVTKE